MAQDNPAFTPSLSDIPLGYRRGAEERDAAVDQSSAVKSRIQPARGAQAGGKDIEADEYDPHAHNEVDHPTSNIDTLFHLLKGCFGTGILAMPEAFMYSGYVVGIISTFVIGFVCTWAVHILIAAEYELSRRRRIPTLSYSEAGRAALEDGPIRLRWLSKYMSRLINLFVLSNQMGACIAYFLFMASNIKAVADHYSQPLDLRLHMLFVLIPVVLLNWVRNLKRLALFSSMAMLATFASFGIILYYVFRTLPTLEGRIPVGNISNYPLFFGTAVFSLEAMGVMIPLKNEMKQPKRFGGLSGVLNQAMVPIVILFNVVGFFGYLQYGSGVKASVTLNLPQEDILAQSVRIMMALAVFVSHGLMNYVVFDTIWLKYLQPKCEARKMAHKRMITYEYLFRTFLVLVHFTLGAIFQNLGLVISLVGAFCLSMIGLTFPAFIHLCTFWYSRKSQSQFIIMVAQDVFLMALGMGMLVIGTYTSIRDMIKDFNS